MPNVLLLFGEITATSAESRLKGRRKSQRKINCAVDLKCRAKGAN